MGEVIPFRPRPVTTGQQSSGAHSAGAGKAAADEATAREVGRASVVPDTPRAPSSPRSLGREPLWRDVTGAVLAQERHRQQRTLAQVADRAGMSVQYLSELERGRKEASSEMLAAACGSLGLTLADFATRCAGLLGSAAARPGGQTLLAA